MDGGQNTVAADMPQSDFGGKRWHRVPYVLIFAYHRPYQRRLPGELM